ncbi:MULTISPECIES: hypothetical protein [Arsenicicoccus]|nr:MULTISPECIES: hypothetical protein [Arsenicicoccus]
MSPHRTKAYLDARHLLRKHQETHGELRGVIARRTESDPTGHE